MSGCLFVRTSYDRHFYNDQRDVGVFFKSVDFLLAVILKVNRLKH